MDLSIGLSQEQQVRVSPSLIALNQILALSSQELQEEIQREISENPALEMDARQVCPTCGSAYNGRVCQRCLAENNGAMANRSVNDHKSTSDDFGSENYEDYYTPDENWSAGGRMGEEEFDPITIVAAEMSLSERISIDLTSVLNPDDMAVADYLIGSLDERGYLSTSVEAVAESFQTEVERVERILRELQNVAPPGVGARDFRECLLIQLRYLKEQGLEAPHVEELIEKHFTALGEHKYGYIAQQMGISVDNVNAAREYIKDHLNPFPAEGHSGELNGTQYRNGSQRAGYVVPDVIISEREGQYEVEVVESKRFFLKVNPLYLRLSGDTTASSSEEDRQHVRQYVARAKFFMSNINQRRETMSRITKALVETQEEFLRDGVRGLRPLTRSMLASRIGIHESTVSRATAGKYVMLPNRKVIGYSDFFTASLSIKDVIKEIIETEGHNRVKPLTDQDIVERLETRGIRVARRTVAKYRAQLKILPSTLR